MLGCCFFGLCTAFCAGASVFGSCASFPSSSLDAASFAFCIAFWVDGGVSGSFASFREKSIADSLAKHSKRQLAECSLLTVCAVVSTSGWIAGEGPFLALLGQFCAVGIVLGRFASYS